MAEKLKFNALCFNLNDHGVAMSNDYINIHKSLLYVMFCMLTCRNNVFGMEFLDKHLNIIHYHNEVKELDLSKKSRNAKVVRYKGVLPSYKGFNKTTALCL